MKKSLRFACDSGAITTAVFALMKSIDTPHSLAVWLCYKYDHTALVDLELNPRHYGDAKLALISENTPQRFAYDLHAHEFLAKYKGLELGVDRKEKAIQSFKTSEERMRIVNAQLKKLSDGSNPRFEAIVSIARRKISDVLGLRCDAHFSFGWGPGSTYTVKGDVGWDKKILEKRISVTRDAAPLASVAIGADIHWCHARGITSEGPCSLLPCEFRIVPGNRITTVDKNAKTDRTIAIEPTANIFLQKGVGSWIRARLKRLCRIDLDDQTVNQKFAGRLDYATIDLKAASDSISRELVKLLLPEEWTWLLDVLRSRTYTLGSDQPKNYEKWSTMGNGYTFELETLVFYSLAFAVQNLKCRSPHVLTYGDDIIVPVEHAVETIDALRSVGFETNVKKTHYDSLYRESCGVHFFDQWEITPIYQKELIDHVAELHHLANRLRHTASRLGGHHFSDATFRPAWLGILQCYPKNLPFMYLPYVGEAAEREGIDGEEVPLVDRSYKPVDGGFFLSIEDCIYLGLPVLRYGTKHKRLVFLPSKRAYDQGAALAYTLGTRSALSSDELALRGRGVHRIRTTRVRQSYRSNVWL